jgi:hypothetical protein
MASGGSYVVAYEAEVHLSSGNTRCEVKILSTEPEDADLELVEIARDAIRRGAERVLQRRGQGAALHVRRLVIHPVDFKSSTFEQFTAEELQRVLDNEHT